MERVILPHDETGSNDVRDFFTTFIVAVGRLERERTTGLYRHEAPAPYPMLSLSGDLENSFQIGGRTTSDPNFELSRFVSVAHVLTIETDAFGV